MAKNELMLCSFDADFGSGCARLEEGNRFDAV